MPEIAALIPYVTPIVERLDPPQRERLERLVRQFIQDTPMEHADGIDVSLQMQVTIAVQACMLLVNRRVDDFGKEVRIIIHERPIDVGRLASGVYHSSGTIELMWDKVLSGGFNPSDGCNVVMHEFAHRLDARHMLIDGAPPMPSIVCQARWALTMGDEFQAFKAAVERGEQMVVDHYAATDPAEFFAVMTEALFERPRLLQQHFPVVYKWMTHFYGDGTE